MCGILGIAAADSIDKADIAHCIDRLFLLSESRGKEAAGAALISSDKIDILKSASSASRMIQHSDYRKMLCNYMNHTTRPGHEDSSEPVTMIGHSRLVTTGDSNDHHNNQPVSAGNMVGIHNGIIVNHDSIWTSNKSLKRLCDVDSEIIFALTGNYVEQGISLQNALGRTFSEIEGAASIAAVHKDHQSLMLATNNGSLYYLHSPQHGIFVFSSERYILKQLIRTSFLKNFIDPQIIRHLLPGTGLELNLQELSIHEFALSAETPSSQEQPPPINRTVSIQTLSGKSPTHRGKAHRSVGMSNTLSEDDIRRINQIKDEFPHNTQWQDSLKRCTKCVLPETMPFISFNSDGVCNYCTNYRPLRFKGHDELEKMVQPHRNSSDLPDSVVGISGGRDSMYMLHYVKTVLGMNPVAYTYDWGMVTDLARRNISRICGKLGIEHIVVSADIPRKRENIRKNIQAWLKKPDLGMIPLFMAGDKQYYSNLYKVQKHLNVKLAVLGENMLERTDFKTGFAGVKPYNLDSSHVYTLPLSDRLRMIGYYAGQFLRNPGYLNQSLTDTASAYASYYLSARTYLNLYNYIPWLEEEVVPTLLNEYDFELAPDSNTTWRIGDGTAAFYNYIYFNVAGFTENETFRSNQIREGYITREKALSCIRKENEPRFETIFWYLSIINMDMDMRDVIKTIHDIPRRKGTA